MINPLPWIQKKTRSIIVFFWIFYIDIPFWNRKGFAIVTFIPIGVKNSMTWNKMIVVFEINIIEEFFLENIEFKKNRLIKGMEIDKNNSGIIEMIARTQNVLGMFTKSWMIWKKIYVYCLLNLPPDFLQFLEIYSFYFSICIHGFFLKDKEPNVSNMKMLWIGWKHDF